MKALCIGRQKMDDCNTGFDLGGLTVCTLINSRIRMLEADN
jgi:hypothetical protein